jgi:tetrahydromethanopterin S-methyltransferase subunit F
VLAVRCPLPWIVLRDRGEGAPLPGAAIGLGQPPVDAHRDVVAEYVAQLFSRLTGAQQVTRDHQLDAGVAQSRTRLAGLAAAGGVQRHLGPALAARRLHVPVGLAVAHDVEARLA